MRSEISGRSSPQALSRHRRAERSPKPAQPLQPLVSKQDERAIAAPNPKARGSIERNIERLHADFGSCLACHPDGMRREIKREQCNVQAILFDESAVESSDAFENCRQPINACRRGGVWHHRKKQPTAIA
jgi:hypothetical protein